MSTVYTLEHPMAPPWFMYPALDRYSIGWRMGYGESYVMAFAEWYETLSERERDTYREWFPAPVGWTGWYEEEEADDNDFAQDEAWFGTGDAVPAYSAETLNKEIQAGKRTKYIFFWGHRPDAKGQITKSCLSQWWGSDFAVETDRYFCMEQYMMAEKARLFGDKETLAAIMSAGHPKTVKDLGRKVTPFREEVWSRKRYGIVRRGNLAKFMQNEELMRFLLQTRDRVLVEASPVDRIWGIGRAADDPDIEQPGKWRGENLLGWALMEVRDELRRISGHYSKLNLEQLHRTFG